MRSNEKMGQDEFYEILYDSNPIETSDIYPVLSLVAQLQKSYEKIYSFIIGYKVVYAKDVKYDY